MTKSKLAILTGAIAVGVASIGLWQWGPLAHNPKVPDCAELASALPSAVEGSWTLTRSEPNRKVSDSLVGCEFDFQSADRSYKGKVTLDVMESDDAEQLRKNAETGPCYGEAVPSPSAASYKVARYCLEKINDKAFAGVFVASDDRYAHTLAEFSSPSLSPAQVESYANTSAQRIVDRAMSLEASE